LDLSALKKEVFGTVPTSTSLPSIFSLLHKWNDYKLNTLDPNDNPSWSIVSGKLDLKRIILGGHSAGGIAALHNANSELWRRFPGN